MSRVRLWLVAFLVDVLVEVEHRSRVPIHLDGQRVAREIIRQRRKQGRAGI